MKECALRRKPTKYNANRKRPHAQAASETAPEPTSPNNPQIAKPTHPAFELNLENSKKTPSPCLADNSDLKRQVSALTSQVTILNARMGGMGPQVLKLTARPAPQPAPQPTTLANKPAPPAQPINTTLKLSLSNKRGRAEIRAPTPAQEQPQTTNDSYAEAAAAATPLPEFTLVAGKKQRPKSP